MRRLLLLCAAPTAASSADGSCAAQPARSGQLLQLKGEIQQGFGPLNLSYGSSGCPCIGLDRSGGNVTPQGAASSQATYPANVGAHCDAWETQCAHEHVDWCKKRWCFVDPCNCNVSSKEHASWQGATWQGRPVYASSATCEDAQAQKKEKKGTQPSNCKRGKFDEELFGQSGCKCIGIAGIRGNLSVNISGVASLFPADLGARCEAWDQGRHPDCRSEDPPAWCGRQWCLVDPCACNISQPPKVSGYFPKATYGEKPLYYSYETCGSLDTYTMDSHSACVNQATEARCLALGADPDEPELRKCAWGGPELKCLGKELLHACRASDETLAGWSWWSFNRGAEGGARTSNVAFVVTASLYSLLALLFVCIARGVL